MYINIDGYGRILSGLCAIHCMALPWLAIMLSIDVLHSFEVALWLLAGLFIITSCIRNCPIKSGAWIWFLTGAGLAVVGHNDWLQEKLNLLNGQIHWISVGAAISVMMAHYKQSKAHLLHKCSNQCQHKK
jgi:hypothetical protein